MNTHRKSASGKGVTEHKRAARAKESLRSRTMNLPDTSKKIRYLSAQGLSVVEIEKLLEEFGVRTQNGGHIRYQHIRNVLVTNLTTEH